MKSPLHTVMLSAAQKASVSLRRDFGEVEKLQVSRKGTANFVTKADTRTEKLLVDELKRARPAYGFLLEEGGEIAGREGTHRWIIDPLDGTTNFIHAVPYVCISIALEHLVAEGGPEIVAGLVYDPLRDEAFFAEKGKGTFLNDYKVRVSSRDALADALIGSGSPHFGSPEYQASIEVTDAVREQVAGVRFMGAAALDLAYVAAGRFDGYWHLAVKPWDVAAGALLVKEAGGKVSTVSGNGSPVHSGSICAGNAPVYGELSTLLRKSYKG